MSNNKLETDKIRKSRAKTYKYVAEFADFQYQQISDYMKSDVFQEQVKVAKEWKKGLSDVKSAGSKRLANQSKIESSQIEEIQKKQNRFLSLAMAYDFLYLQQGIG